MAATRFQFAALRKDLFHSGKVQVERARQREREREGEGSSTEIMLVLYSTKS
jgi:hypothetical protein